MPAADSARTPHPIRVVLSSAALLPFTTLPGAGAHVLSQLGATAFFLPAVAAAAMGTAAPWFVLGAVILAAFVRTIDVECWGLLIPGGLVGAVREAFGPRAEAPVAAMQFVERLLFGSLCAVVIGHYVVAAAVDVLSGGPLRGFVLSEDLAIILAMLALALIWIPARLGREPGRQPMTRLIWIGVAILVTTVVWGLVTLLVREPRAAALVLAAPTGPSGTALLSGILPWLFGAGVVLPALGGGEVLARTAHDCAPPRVQALRRLSGLTNVFALVVTLPAALLFAVLVQGSIRGEWIDAPLIGLSQALAAPGWARHLMSVAVAAAAGAMLWPAARAALTDLERLLQQWSLTGPIWGQIASVHARLGTPARAVDISVMATALVIVVSGTRIVWLAHAYALSVGVIVVLKAATLARLRRRHLGPRPFSAPLNVRVGKGERPIGLVLSAGVVAVAVVALILGRDVPAMASLVFIVALTLWLTVHRERGEVTTLPIESAFDLLPPTELSLEDVNARPGNVLVSVRNPHALDHVAAALRAAGDRDIVVMTVRLRDVDPDGGAGGATLASERRLFADVVALSERYGVPVRLLLVPAHHVPDAVVAAAVRLRSSEIYIGESASLSADQQARLLGDAWEHVERPDALHVRVVIQHRSGRSDVYHLGAHAPELSPRDLDLIHRLWLDATAAVGTHVHHHDIVKAALTQMAQQLTGPERDAALAAIRSVAQPAEEFAAVLRAKDYTRLRDMLRNREGSDVAALLSALTVEDQVVVFRVLPRKDAAAAFEYLEQEAKEALLKAMAQEEVAALISNMAPDERTLFLEELPAEATKQMLALLTPEERSVAVKLLGYPEDSVGRLMTPHYVAVREHWTVSAVLDYVRAHGHDSETLNVIYVVDDQGVLVDDVRIREFLLAPLDRRVLDLMDRQFVSLKATDGQQDAVAIFKQNDRTALPVTDTAGALIGIVTIDDVLDVAEEAATREIQRIGGSEALDEPYMEIAFGSMIKKRAGWLTALFIGEMLTATAMGVFEAEISKAVVLALFVPLIISSGGNSGSQASTLVIRALALGEVTLLDWWKVVRREFFAGLALGTILGTIGFLRISLWSAFSDIYGPHWLLVAITVSVSLVGVVLWGTLSGSVLPFVLKRLGFDPAASSAPFVATLVDVTGLVIYFSVGIVVLRGTLL